MTPEFIRAIPKTDLHVHLDGSLRLGTLIELARSQKISLPSKTPSGLRETVFKDRYANLEEYLHGFQYTCAVLRDAESLERVAYELAMDNFAEGVRYIEPRFAPQLCASDRLTLEGVLVAVDRGLARAKREINGEKAIRSGQEPAFDYAIIGCAMRKFGTGFSPYFEKFISTHRYTHLQNVYPSPPWNWSGPWWISATVWASPSRDSIWREKKRAGPPTSIRRPSPTPNTTS
jgi:adenosine deaminase